MKTQSLDSMKGKYNSQMQEYLRLAEILKTEREKVSLMPKNVVKPVEFKIVEVEEEKAIIPSRKRVKAKRAERAETLKESVSKRMRKLELESFSLDKSKQELPTFIDVTDPIKPAIPQKRTDGNEVENPRKKRKVELERERRKGLTQLFDELDYWVEMGSRK